jgi:hypothetical protein
MNGRINVFEVACFACYFLIVVGVILLIGNHDSEGLRIIAVITSVCSWPFVRKRLFGLLFKRLSRHPPTASHDGD